MTAPDIKAFRVIEGDARPLDDAEPPAPSPVRNPPLEWALVACIVAVLAVMAGIEGAHWTVQPAITGDDE